MYLSNTEDGLSDRMQQIRAKMELNELLSFLSGLKQRDRELIEYKELAEDDPSDLRYSYGTKSIKWKTNGTIISYENKVEPKKKNSGCSLPGLTKRN